jgi:hypothetical protein
MHIDVISFFVLQGSVARICIQVSTFGPQFVVPSFPKSSG